MLGIVNGDTVQFQTKLIAVLLWVPLILVMVTLTAFFVWYATSPALPNQSLSSKALPQSAVGAFGAFMFGALSFWLFYRTTPFYLSVNLASRTYKLARGVRPLAFYSSGSLSEIKELRVDRVSTQSSGELFLMRLIWKKRGRSPIPFDQIKDENKAYHLIQEAADILRVPPSSISA